MERWVVWKEILERPLANPKMKFIYLLSILPVDIENSLVLKSH